MTDTAAEWPPKGVEYTTITFPLGWDFTICKHETGTYRSIPARWFGRREVYVCRDCDAILNTKTMREV